MRTVSHVSEKIDCGLGEDGRRGDMLQCYNTFYYILYHSPQEECIIGDGVRYLWKGTGIFRNEFEFFQSMFN